MAENLEKVKQGGFQRGLKTVYATCTAAEYTRCMEEVREVCMTTEERSCSRSSYYNKMYGRTLLTVAETERLNEVFARYGVTDWQGEQ